MAERLETLEPGSQRYLVLECAIHFKRSWVELARHLTSVRSKNAFTDWGYRTFEAYAQHELVIRRETAQKLVRSFDFLAAYEKPVLRAIDGDSASTPPLPSYQALDILAEARRNPELAETDYKDIRDQVFREDPAPAALRKLVRERAPEAPKGQAEEDSAARLRKCLNLAERLYGMVLEEDLPDQVARSMEKVLGSLRKVIGDE